ncbi:MAG: hypothetical protein WBF09_05030 [Candidatus Acidiferrum sp.]
MNAEEAFQSALKVAIDTTAYPECRPLLEQAAALVNAGKVAVFSYRGLSVREQENPGIVRYRARVQQLYGNPSYAVGTCLHEAAHAILMNDNGVQNVKFSGPGIQRNPDGSMFPYGARVDGDPRIGREIDAALIFERTTDMVVGGVAMQKYSGINDVSDAKDYEVFLLNCASTPQFFKEEKPEELWARAIKRVDPWLEQPETKRRIFAKAAEYLAQVYP